LRRTTPRIGDPNFFYEWDEAVAFYEKESDEDWDDDFDDPWDNEDGDEDDNEYYI